MQRTYRPTHKPPTWTDRLLVHPVQTIVLGLGTLVFGVLLALGQLVDGHAISPPVADLTAWQGWLMATALTVGGAVTLVAIVGHLPDWEAQIIAERLGTACAGIGWAMYAGAVALSDGRYQGAIILGVTLAAACALRLVVLQMIVARARGTK